MPYEYRMASEMLERGLQDGLTRVATANDARRVGAAFTCDDGRGRADGPIVPLPQTAGCEN